MINYQQHQTSRSQDTVEQFLNTEVSVISPTPCQLTANKIKVLFVDIINLSTRFCNSFSDLCLFLYGVNKITKAMEKVCRE